MHRARPNQRFGEGVKKKLGHKKRVLPSLLLLLHRNGSLPLASLRRPAAGDVIQRPALRLEHGADGALPEALAESPDMHL